MTRRPSLNEEALDFFEGLWGHGDHWDLESSEFERAKYAWQLGMIQGSHYGRVLEIGCGSGCLTRMLALLADHVLAVDISPTAIARARSQETQLDHVEFRVENIMERDLRSDQPWDLIVLSETIYYLGWLYPFFDIAWLASELLGATSNGGRLLMANTMGSEELEQDHLLLPWLIKSYRDLFLSVGYRLEAEKDFRGTKDGQERDVLVSLFTKQESPRSAIQ